MVNATWQAAAAWTDLTDGTPIVVSVEGFRVLLLRQADAVYAADALCPHKFGPLEEGAVGSGCITCPIHDATFDLVTGSPGAGEGWAGQLPTYAARRDPEDPSVVQVRLSGPSG